MKRILLVASVCLFANVGNLLAQDFQQLLQKDIESIMKMPQENDGAFEDLVSGLADPDKRNSKNRAWKIASATVGYAFKIRTAVRWAYEEVKLWTGIGESFVSMYNWFKNMPDTFRAYKDSVHSFFTTRGNFVSKLEHLVDLYDDFDRDIASIPNRLDYRLLSIEHRIDRAVADTFTYHIGPFSHTLTKTPGVFFPNTAEMFEALDNMIVTGLSMPVINPPSEISFTESQPKEVNPYEGVIIANQLIAAHAMSMSMEYRKWGQVAANNLEALDQKFESAFEQNAGVNRKEMAAAWYAIENANANNKRLRHSLEEAKLHQALIGTDLHIRTNQIAQRKQQALQFLALTGDDRLD